jgi:hypothetical protein
MFFSQSLYTLGHIQRHTQWVTGALFPEVKRPEHEADLLHLSSAEVKNSWSFTCFPPYTFYSVVFSHRDNFYYTAILLHHILFDILPKRNLLLKPLVLRICEPPIHWSGPAEHWRTSFSLGASFSGQSGVSSRRRWYPEQPHFILLQVLPSARTSNGSQYSTTRNHEL